MFESVILWDIELWNKPGLKGVKKAISFLYDLYQYDNEVIYQG